MQSKKEVINAFGKRIALCRNLPFGGRATSNSRVRVPRKEYARSRHQRLFEENVGKTEKDGIYELLSERFGSCIYARGRYQRPTRPSQGTAAFNRMCKHDFDFYVPFYVLISFIPFLYFSLFVVDKGVSLCSYVFLNWDEKIRPTQFFLMRESSDSFYLKGDHFKALDLKNNPFYLIRN